MRKNFKLIMIGILTVSALSVTACGGKGDKAETTAESTVESTVATTEGSSETAAESTTESAGEISSAAAADIKGSLNGDVYTNDEFNIKFDAKAGGMVMAGSEEFNAMRSMSNDDTLEMYAYDDSYTKIVMFGVLKDNTDIKSYIDENIATIKKDNEGIGENNIKVESSTLKFLGEDAPCLNAQLTSGGVTEYHTQVFIKSGDHVAVIAVNGLDEQSTKDCLAMFTKAK
nr:acyl carrier protein [uncultured Lachnoanaerobaculum sp.]